jgi:hypothetical protein
LRAEPRKELRPNSPTLETKTWENKEEREGGVRVDQYVAWRCNYLIEVNNLGTNPYPITIKFLIPFQFVIWSIE